MLGVPRNVQRQRKFRARVTKSPRLQTRRRLRSRALARLNSTKRTLQLRMPAVTPKSKTRLGMSLGESCRSHPSELPKTAAVEMEAASRTAA